MEIIAIVGIVVLVVLVVLGMYHIGGLAYKEGFEDGYEDGKADGYEQAKNRFGNQVFAPLALDIPYRLIAESDMKLVFEELDILKEAIKEGNETAEADSCDFIKDLLTIGESGIRKKGEK